MTYSILVLPFFSACVVVRELVLGRLRVSEEIEDVRRGSSLYVYSAGSFFAVKFFWKICRYCEVFQLMRVVNSVPLCQLEEAVRKCC